MKASEGLAERAEKLAGLKVWAEYYGETVAAGYLDAALSMLLEQAKRMKEGEDEEERRG